MIGITVNPPVAVKKSAGITLEGVAFWVTLSSIHCRVSGRRWLVVYHKE